MSQIVQSGGAVGRRWRYLSIAFVVLTLWTQTKTMVNWSNVIWMGFGGWYFIIFQNSVNRVSWARHDGMEWTLLGFLEEGKWQWTKQWSLPNGTKHGVCTWRRRHHSWKSITHPINTCIHTFVNNQPTINRPFFPESKLQPQLPADPDPNYMSN